MNEERDEHTGCEGCGICEMTPYTEGRGYLCYECLQMETIEEFGFRLAKEQEEAGEMNNHTQSVLDVAQRHGYIGNVKNIQAQINLLQAVCMDTYPKADWVQVREELIKTCNENNKREAECTHQNVSDDRGAKAW